MTRLLSKCDLHSFHPHRLSAAELSAIAQQTRGYSGADIEALCKEAAGIPAHAAVSAGGKVEPEDVPAITIEHLQTALLTVNRSVKDDQLQQYIDWNAQFGSWKEAGQTLD